MQFQFPFGLLRSRQSTEPWLLAGPRRVQLRFIRHRRARRYVLRLGPDGSARVTVPRGGSLAEAKRFAERNTAWLERQLLRQATLPTAARAWNLGTKVLFRGESLPLEAGVNGETGRVRLGSEVVRVRDVADDLRPELERHLWRLARRELPIRVMDLARGHDLAVQRVTVRNQRSRWGSCSRHGTISLNWRLVQAPLFVRDYIILHELAHLKEMNHSRRFWREVERLCSGFREAERWLKGHAELLR